MWYALPAAAPSSKPVAISAATWRRRTRRDHTNAAVTTTPATRASLLGQRKAVANAAEATCRDTFTHFKRSSAVRTSAAANANPRVRDGVRVTYHSTDATEANIAAKKTLSELRSVRALASTCDQRPDRTWNQLNPITTAPIVAKAPPISHSCRSDAPRVDATSNTAAGRITTGCPAMDSARATARRIIACRTTT
jgi:hypothetical protein